ncbi:MAG: hypothetical protein J6Q53_06965 [Oscillospiraceae bacterium]|nr:hypothetical protein [Oscillospiraceae bacterium]
MARRKYEFRPDKTNSDLLGKLYLTQKQRMKLLKWCLYALLLVVLSAIQDVILCRMSILSATTDLLPCAILLICVLQGSHTGSVFSLVAACMYQFSGTAPGYYVIVLLPALGIAAAIFRQTYLRKGFSAAMLCAGVALMLYEMCLFGICLLFSLITASRIIVFLLTGGLSLLVMPALYPIIMTIEKIGGETWKE